MEHPFFDKRRFYITYFFVWILILFAHSYLLVTMTGWEWKTALPVSMITDGIFIVLSLLSWYPVRGMYANSSGIVNLFIAWLVFVFLFLLLWILLAYPLVMVIFPETKVFLPFVSGIMPWQIVSGFFLAVITLMVYYLILSEEEMKEKTLRESKLKALVMETELQFMKNQLNSHFLFNVLNNIGSLILQKPDQAREMLVKMSDYLRNVLDYERREYSTIREEMVQIRLYLDLEQIRFEDPWNIQEEIDEGCEDHLIPVMILQPLFENAVRYAVYDESGKGFIRFICRKRDDSAEVVLENSYDPSALVPAGQGIGLRNIRQRLQMIYGRDDLLQINRKEDTFEVVLMVPPGPYENHEKTYI